jgi:hypothetical protein
MEGRKMARHMSDLNYRLQLAMNALEEIASHDLWDGMQEFDNEDAYNAIIKRARNALASIKRKAVA